MRKARCFGGARACPPEDCGGDSGFENLLRVLKNPKDEDYARLREWVGDEYDPKHFSLDDINEDLKSLKLLKLKLLNGDTPLAEAEFLKENPPEIPDEEVSKMMDEYLDIVFLGGKVRDVR